MTDVLWLLYAADVVDNLGFVCFIVGPGSLIALIACGVAYADAYSDEERAKWGKHMVRAASAVFTVLLLAAVLPSRTTIYAAAALSAGETAVQTEVGQKALKALETWLDKQAEGDEE